MDIDEDGVTDPTTEFGDLFEGQTVAFENELEGHDADDVLGAISHDLGITSGPHHRSTHPSDQDILEANLNFVPDDYLHGQQIVMDHENTDYNMALPEDAQHQNLQTDHQQQQPHDPGTTEGTNSQQQQQNQIYIQTVQQPVDQQQNANTDATSNASMNYEYNYNQTQVQPDVSQPLSQSVSVSNNGTSDEPPAAEEEIPEGPKVKQKMKVVKDVEYFTNENMERYMKRRGFISKRGEVDSTRIVSKAVFALCADSQISNDHCRLVSFGSRDEPEFVVQEMERFWKFYLSTKSKNSSLSAEFLPMLFPMFLHFYFEMLLSHMIPIARRICMDFSKKFLHEDKTQAHYDLLVAVMKVNSVESLKTDSILSPLINQKYEFTLSEQALSLLRHFLSKSTHPTLIHLFTKRFKITCRESKELIQSFDWDNLDSESSSSSSDEEDEVYPSRSYVSKVIEDLRNSATANLPAISVYTTGDDPVCGNISKLGSLIAYGLQEAGIRLCTVENARDVETITESDEQPTEPEEHYGIKSIGGHAGTVYGVHFHPRTKLLFSVGQDSLMRAWDLNQDDPQCRAVYRGHSGPIWKLDIPESGSLIATSGLDSTARIFVPERTEFVRVMPGHYCSVNAVKFHPNEAYIATGSADKSARLWSIHDGNIVRMFTGSAASVNCVAFHDSGKYLAGAGEDDKIIIWDLAQGEILAKLDALPNCRDLEFNGNMLSACYRNGMLQVFNLRRIVGGAADYNDEDDDVKERFLPSISPPFTTKCFAKTLFKVHHLDSGRLLCLGSDMSMDVDQLFEAARASFEEEMADANDAADEEVSQQQNSSETLLQQVLQANIPPLLPIASTSSSSSSKSEKQSKKQSGVVTVMGSNGSSRILAARLSQPIPSTPSSVSSEFRDSIEGSDSAIAIPDNPQSDALALVPVTAPGSVPPVVPTTNTPQMITSAELDAAIASVIDQSGCSDNSEGGGTITMYASS